MKGELKYLLALEAMALAVYLPVILGGHTLVDQPTMLDVTFNFMPNISWMAQSWREGLFPLWNQHTHLGAPLLAYTHCGGLYPVGALLFSLLPYIWANTANIVFHALVAGPLVYLAVRRQKSEPIFALAAGTGFIFSGYYFGMMYIPWMLGSTCGLLLAWICVHESIQRPRLIYFLGATVGFAWCGIAGDSELLVYGSVFLGLVLLARTGIDRARLLRLVFLFSLPAVAGCLLILSLVLPTLENIHWSIRGPMMPYRLRIVSIGDIWPLFLPTMLYPFRYLGETTHTYSFNGGLSPVYQNFLFPFLLGLGIWESIKRKWERPLTWVAVAVFLFVFLRGAPIIGSVFDRLPIIGHLEFPAKALLIFQLFTLMIFARLLSSGLRDPALARRIALALVLAGIGLLAAQPFSLGGGERYLIGAVAVAVGVLGWVGRGGKPALSAGTISRTAAVLIIFEGLSLAFRQAPSTDPARFELDPRLEAFARSVRPETRYAIFEQLLTEDYFGPPPIFGSFELASGAANIVGPSRVLPARSFLYLSQLLPAMIFTADNGDYTLDSWSMTNPVSIDRARLHLLHLAGATLILSRGMPVPYTSPYPLLKPNALDWTFAANPPQLTAEGGLRFRAPAAMRAKFAGLRGDRLTMRLDGEVAGWAVVITSAGDRTQSRLMTARRLDRGETAAIDAAFDKPERDLNLALGFLPQGRGTAGLLLSTLEVVNPERPLQLLSRFGTVEAFANREALPRAFMVHRVESLPDLETTMDRIGDASHFSPRWQAFLEKGDAKVHPVQRPPEGAEVYEEVKIEAYGSQRVEMSVRTLASGYLLFTDSYFPGWRARVQTRGAPEWEARIVPADLAFRTIRLPAGKHSVIWTYEPISFSIGLWVNLASLLFLAVWGVCRVSKRGLAS